MITVLSRLRRLFAGFLFVGLLIHPRGFSLSGIPEQEAAQEVIEHQVTVALKLLQVYVTDKSGNAVTDLERTDFSVYDRGYLKEITDFERHVLAAPERIEGVPAGASESSQTPLLSRKFILLIDFARNDNIGIKRTKKAALHFLEKQVRPADEVAVMTYGSYSGVGVHENLTTDHDRIREAVSRITDIPGYGKGGGFSLLGEGVPGEAARGIDVPTGVEELAPGYEMDWEHLKKRAVDFAVAMQDLAKALRYVPGFKNIVLFSSGLTRNLLYDLEDSRVRTEYEVMIKELASANCPVFSVNAEGQRAFLKDQAERGDHSLQGMAERSGGQYFHDIGQEDRIADEIREMTGNFYVLGFCVDEVQDGEFHDLRVEVKRDNCDVYTQAGYFNPKPFAKYSKFEKRLHLFDLAMSEKPQFRTPLELPLFAAPKPGGGEPSLALFAELAVDRLKEIIEGRFELAGLIFDEGNSIVEVRRREFESKSLDRPVYYPYALAALPPGRYKCRLVLRNLDSGKGAVGTADVAIEEDFPSGSTVLPPLFFVPDNPTFYLGLSGKDVRSAETEIIALQEFCPQIGVRMTPVLDVLDQGLSNLTALVRFFSTEPASRTPVFTVSLLDEASGETMSVPLSIIEVLRDEEAVQPEREGSRGIVAAYTLVAAVKLPRAAPGSYLLTVGIEQPETGDGAEAARRIKIR